jgi:hypothetical protein
MSTTKAKNSRTKPRGNEEDEQLVDELLAIAKSGRPLPKKGTRLGDALIRFQEEEDAVASAVGAEAMKLKAELLALSPRGPKPRRGTLLGDALFRFTTKAKSSGNDRKAKGKRLYTSDELAVADARARERQEVAAGGIKRQRPNYLAKGQKHT